MGNTKRLSLFYSKLVQRHLFDSLRDDFQIGIEKDFANWLRVRYAYLERISPIAGKLVHQFYDGCLYKALLSIYPEYDWRLRGFSGTQRMRWTSKREHSEFFDIIAERFGIMEPSDWYRIRISDIFRETGVRTLLSRHYEGSLLKALQSIYPNYHWEAWRFGSVPRRFWLERKNQRCFFLAVVQRFTLGESQEGYYQMKFSDISEAGGSSLLIDYYDGSLMKALQKIFPECYWQSWKFTGNVVHGFWQDIQNQLEYFNWIEAQSISGETDTLEPSVQRLISMNYWYQSRIQDIPGQKVSVILRKFYNGSLIRALQTIYPEYGLKCWGFRKVPQGYWNCAENIIAFLRSIAGILQLRNSQDWLSISSEQLRLRRCQPMLRKTGGWNYLRSHLMASNYRIQEGDLPERTHCSKDQWFLLKMIQCLFPIHTTIQCNYQMNSMKFSRSSKSMELDIFVPEFHLALEFQGQQHYHYNLRFGNHPLQQQRRDSEKHKICEKNGLTLIEVPHWKPIGDLSISYLLRNHRPDLPLASTTSHLPENMCDLSLLSSYGGQISSIPSSIVERFDNQMIGRNQVNLKSKVSISFPSRWKNALKDCPP